MKTINGHHYDYVQDTCENPLDIECRAKYTGVSHDATGQVFQIACTVEGGLVCNGSQQSAADGFACFDYEVRLLCPQSKKKTLSKRHYIDGTIVPGL